MSERLTRAMRTDDGELLFSDSFNDYGSRKLILFVLSVPCFPRVLFRLTEKREKKSLSNSSLL